MPPKPNLSLKVSELEAGEIAQFDDGVLYSFEAHEKLHKSFLVKDLEAELWARQSYLKGYEDGSDTRKDDTFERVLYFVGGTVLGCVIFYSASLISP